MDNKKEATDPIALEYAGFWRRFGALIIDLIVISIPSWIMGPVWGLGIYGFEYSNGFPLESGLIDLPPLVFADFVPTIIGIGYFIALWAWHGQTVGKMVAQIKVIRTDGTKVGVGTAIIRYLGYIVCGLTLFIGFLWIVIDRRKQGFHDMMEDTCVVKVPKVTAPQASASAGA